ncbi:unnamed protein product, partial [marine sediment metagenome]
IAGFFSGLTTIAPYGLSRNGEILFNPCYGVC